MATIEKSTFIAAPVERIYAILADPDRLPQFAPGVSRVEDVRRTADGVGTSARIVYSVMGIEFPMIVRLTEHEPPHRAVVAMSGGIDGTQTWTLVAQGDGTRLGDRVEYELRGGLLGKALDALLVERMNEKNIERMLENLKLLGEHA
jgi:carbon monoxide dehydrogenase subunit G